MNIRKTALAAALAIVCANSIASPVPIATLAVGDNAGGVALDPVLGYAFVTNYDDGTVSEIDLDTKAVTATIPAGEKPRRIVDNSVLHRLYFVNDTTPGTVTVLDTTVNGMLARIPVGDRPRNIAADFQKGEVYVSNRDGGTLSVIDVATNDVVATVETGRNPGGIDVDTRLRRIYVPSALDGTVAVIDQDTHALVRKVAVGRNPGAATVDERSGKVYVNNVDDRTISVLDGSGALIATLAGGAGSTFGTVSAVYRRYYLPNADDATLTIVDIDRDAVTNTIAVGASPQQAIVDAAAGKVYVTDRDSNSVTIVDAASEKATGAFGAGPHPSRIASAMGELLVVNEDGGADSVTIASEPASPDDTSIATEYRSAATSQYFHTADPIEIRLIADGQFADGWTRTMEFWRVWKYAAPGRVPMYRLANSDVPGNAYLYTPYAGETVVQQMSGPWRLEGIAYYAALPDAAGQCAADTTGLYSLINRSQSADRRYTTDTGIRDALLVAGWTNDGTNDTGPLACVPQLRRAVTKPHVIGIVPPLLTRQP